MFYFYLILLQLINTKTQFSMKNLLFSALLILGSAIGFGQVNAYQVGDVVDNFTVTDTDGVEHTLYDITASGKHVVLDFFFTTCGPCQQTQKYYNELHDKYGCNQGEVYTISITGYPGDTDAKVIQFENTYGGPFNHSPAVSIEGNGTPVTSNFGISAYPTYCIIAPDNTLAVRDIWPISNVGSFENAFPSGFAPESMECTEMGVSDLNSQVFSLYPTVSNGQINVNLEQSADSKISVYSMLGQEVYSNSFNAQKNIQLDLKLSSGVYIMKVATSNKQVETKKFIIK